MEKEGRRDDDGVDVLSSRPKARLPQTPCPVCGKFFSSRYIQQHADKCAERTDKNTTGGPGQSIAKLKEGGSGVRRKVIRRKFAKKKASSRQQLVAPEPRQSDSDLAVVNHVVLTTYGKADPKIAPHALTNPHTTGSSSSDTHGQDEEAAPKLLLRRSSERGIIKPLLPRPSHKMLCPKVKVMLAPDGLSETVFFRGGFSIKCEAVPDSYLPRIAAVEHTLRNLSSDAVSIATSKGTIDKKKSLELQQRIQEEEYQLELYRSSATTNRKHRLDIPQPMRRRPAKQQRTTPAEASSVKALTFALVKPDNINQNQQQPLVMRVKVIQDPRRHSAPIRHSSQPPALIRSDASARKVKKDGSIAVGHMATTKHILDNRSSSERITKRQRLISVDSFNKDAQHHHAFFGPDLGLSVVSTPCSSISSFQVAAEVGQKSLSTIPKDSATRRESDRDALDYVERMRNVHHVPPETIAIFVSLLKAYKRKTLASEVVARRIAYLLKDYPDLVADFGKFLPSAPTTLAPGASPEVISLKLQKVSTSQSPESTMQHAANPIYAPQKVQSTFKMPQKVQGHGLQLMGAYQPEGLTTTQQFKSGCHEQLEPKPPLLPLTSQALLSPTKYDPRANPGAQSQKASFYWSDSMTDDEYENDMHGGFSDSDDDENGRTVQKALRQCSVDDLFNPNGYSVNTKDQAAALTISAIPNIRQAAPSEETKVPLVPGSKSHSAYHEKLISTVDQTMKDLSAMNTAKATEYNRDYVRMKSLTYKIWDRFKEDPYTFDAFAVVILRAARAVAKGTATTAIITINDRLRSLFGCEADDLINELMISQGLFPGHSAFKQRKKCTL